jgi:hypothetical protein
MDYPVASQKDGYLPLKQIFDDGACSIGAHLHPWVSPPYNELLSRSNSFPGNLPFNLEKEKIVILKDTIENKFQIRIVNYKAGRYGFGVNTASILEALGFEVDLSPSPGFNFASEGGPNFIHFTNRVFKFGSRKQLICIPCTGGFVGCTGKFMPNIYNICNTPVAVSMKIPGILSRLDVVDRIRLSPEGFLVNDLVKITKFLIKNGVTILTLSFHSPSLLPGSTPYVKDKKDLKNFLLSIREYLHFFKEECRGTFMTPEEIRSKCDNIYNEEKEIGR